MFELLNIDTRIRDIAPGFKAVSIHVDATNAKQGHLPSNILADAGAFVVQGGPAWAEAHWKIGRKPISSSVQNRTGHHARRRHLEREF